ncbi:hypothetical protein RI129_008990 [Pyrocoelia pectoralis]|uniref:HAT C-terminal dimerisation domain-containing protein n=1 Tax=Pyrocoelia pectoralis TaxID=417401 RepID=A0AAN7V9M3_9COLE
MSGVHGGVQRKIRDINPKALFTPCANHSLNLCGVHSFACVPSSVTCFSTLEKLYSFFSVSTHRWEILIQKVGKTLKRLSDTRWSAHHASVKAVRQNVEQLVLTLEEMCDPSKENLDTRSAASVLLPAICDFTFLCYLEFWNMILEEVNLTQKYLQTPEITLDMGLTKMKALQLFLVEERNTLVNKAIQFGTQKCEEMGIDIERRGRRKVKKNLPGEISADAGLTLLEELRRSMFQCLDRFIQELAARSTAMENISSTFHIVQPKLLIKGSENELEQAIEKFNLVYGDFDKEEVYKEVYRLRRHLSATNTATEEAASWTAKNLFEFIIKWDFTESIPNLCLILQYFLTISVSVQASCERSFSKLKLIKNYLRSTMTEERLTSLAILSIERKVASVLDFDDVINKFSVIKARKHNLKLV